jgi:hypothetical protein
MYLYVATTTNDAKHIHGMKTFPINCCSAASFALTCGSSGEQQEAEYTESPALSIIKGANTP